jgi:hypothetical protein
MSISVGQRIFNEYGIERHAGGEAALSKSQDAEDRVKDAVMFSNAKVSPTRAIVSAIFESTMIIGNAV